MEALERAAKILGGWPRVSAVTGASQSAPFMWRKRQRVPPEYCAPLEQATERQVMRWELRPEDWHRIWPELRAVEGAPAVPAEASTEGAGDAQ